MHKEAVEQARACQIVKACEEIRETVQGQVALQKSAVIGAMKCLYWLCKQEIAHTTTSPCYPLLWALVVIICLPWMLVATLTHWYNIITLQFGGGKGEGHASRPPQYQNISIILLHFFFLGENSGCPIGTFPGNCARSLQSDRVQVSIATEQLLFLPNVLELIIWTTVKTYLRWKFCHGFPVIFQHIVSDRIFTTVALFSTRMTISWVKQVCFNPLYPNDDYSRHEYRYR